MPVIWVGLALSSTSWNINFITPANNYIYVRNYHQQLVDLSASVNVKMFNFLSKLVLFFYNRINFMGLWVVSDPHKLFQNKVAIVNISLLIICFYLQAAFKVFDKSFNVELLSLIRIGLLFWNSSLILNLLVNS